MTLQLIGAWLWGQYGKDITDKAGGALKKAWEQFRWNDAATKYHARLKEQHSTMRVLGKPDPVSLEGIFTDAYILDRPTALRHFDIEQLQKAQEENRSLRGEAKRLNALQLAKEKDRLFILGKPGAGKTTFLKYITLQALDNKIEKIPIFISLYEWRNSGLELMPFIARQFEICAFPDANAFIEYLLGKGWAILLFDGLDEVNVEGEQRAKLTTAINNFVKQYPENKFLITCRVAASDYAFDRFVDVEIADFDDEQVKTFAGKWFSGDPRKGERFVTELSKPEHRGLRELAQTPLLLALLCLAFEETLIFPPRRAEIYEEALDALLKKWDASRNIQRDEPYQALSLGRKRQLFARIAAEYFEKGEIFFRQDDLARRVESFVAKLPAAAGNAPDGEAIIKAIESQHGLFVARARGIFSFSHLTLQEYFTARYLVENAADGALERLVNGHLTDYRWREVFLLTASMLPEADDFIRFFRAGVDGLMAGDMRSVEYLKWAAGKAASDYAAVGHPAVARALARATAEIAVRDLARDLARALVRALTRDLPLALDIALDLDLDLDLAGALALARALASDLTLALDLDPDPDLNLDLDLASALILARVLAESFDQDTFYAFTATLMDCLRKGEEMGLTDLHQALRALKTPQKEASVEIWRSFAADLRAIMIRHRNIGHDWELSGEQRERLDQYDKATILLDECLQLASISNRKAIEESLLLPPGEYYLT